MAYEGALVPILKAEYQYSYGGQWGKMIQATHVSGDDVAMLLGSADVARSNVVLEPNTGTLILAPVPRYADFGQAETTVTGTGAAWRDVTSEATGKRTLQQYSGVESIAWSAESNASVIDVDNGGFVVDLYLAAAPKATPAGERDGSGIYRRVSWPSDAASGENMFAVTIPYQDAPFLERSTDAGVTWTLEEHLDCDENFTSLRAAHNIRLSMSVMVVGTQMVVWLGKGLMRGGSSTYDNASYKSGKIKIEGKGGYTGIGFANIRHKSSGYLISYRHFGPRDMSTPTPEFYPYGTSAADLTALSQTVTGSLEATYPTTYEFKYRLTLGAPDIGGDDAGYAKTTPYVKQVTVVWLNIHIAPADDPWTDILWHRYGERIWFDPSTRVLRRSMKATYRIYGEEANPQHGIDAIRVSLKYQHEDDFTLRGYFVGETESQMYSDPDGQAWRTFDGHDLLWFLEPQYLTKRVFPSHWCVYSVARLLLEMGGIVPEYYNTFPRVTEGDTHDPANDGDAFCAFGPDPDGCQHTKVPAHPGWGELTPILACLDEVKDIIFGWYGQTADGQFHFAPFDADAYNVTVKAFTEDGTGDGSDYDMIGGPERLSLQRIRSLSGVKTSALFFGEDQISAAPITKYWRDEDAISTTGAMNYVGHDRPYFHASSLFLSDSFTQAALDKATKWMRLPYDGVYLPLNGQPTLFPTPEMGGLITARDNRILGPDPTKYFVLEVTHDMTFDSIACVVNGLWPGIGAYPGWSAPPPQERSPISQNDLPWARLEGQGSITVT